jgi:hypothetical protein
MIRAVGESPLLSTADRPAGPGHGIAFRALARWITNRYLAQRRLARVAAGLRRTSRPQLSRRHTACWLEVESRSEVLAQKSLLRSPCLEVDVGTDGDDAVLGQAEGLDGVGRRVRHGQEQLLAPCAHARRVAANDGDAGDEVGGVVDVDLAFEADRDGPPQRVGDVVLVLEAALDGDVHDPVVLVAEVVDDHLLVGGGRGRP